MDPSPPLAQYPRPRPLEASCDASSKPDPRKACQHIPEDAIEPSSDQPLQTSLFYLSTTMQFLSTTSRLTTSVGKSWMARIYSQCLVRTRGHSRTINLQDVGPRDVMSYWFRSLTTTSFAARPRMYHCVAQILCCYLRCLRVHIRARKRDA